MKELPAQFAPKIHPISLAGVEPERLPSVISNSALAHPFARRPALAIGVGDADIAAEAEHVAKPQFAEEGEQLLIAEAAIGQDRHPAPRRHQFGQAAQAGVPRVRLRRRERRLS